MRALTLFVATCFVSVSANAGPVSVEEAPEDAASLEHHNDLPKVMILPPEQNIASKRISNLLWIDFCDGDCGFKPGQDDPRTNTSRILQGNSCAGQPRTLSKFAGTPEQRQYIVDCVRDIYAAYNVTVVTEQPEGSTLHHRAVVAGIADREFGCQSDVGGIAPANGDCSPRDNAISFTFANNRAHRVINPGTPQEEVVFDDTLLDQRDLEWLCAVVGQESAHSFGMVDHLYDARDPMTYLNNYPGRKYFRNLNFECGEFQKRPCQCSGATQNSHKTLRNTFGPGEPVTNPEVTVEFPQDGEAVDNKYFVIAEAADLRGVYRVELYVNDWFYDSVDGNEINQQFQELDFDNYTLQTPDLPDGWQNIEIRAYNDIGETYGTATARYLKGAPCESKDTCFDGQECREGGCYWPTPVAELGDECVRDQDCLTGSCTDNDGVKRCTSKCFAGVENSCKDGFECLDKSGGVCWPQGGGGGCNAGGLPLVTLLLFGAGAIVTRRRR